MISIIIPTCDRADQLLVTLKSVAAVDFDKTQFEIIVIDNGSVDHTKKIVDSIISENKNLSIRYFFDNVPGLLTGRHRGATEAKGDILVFVDDDIEADKNWLKAIARSFTDPAVHLVGGKCLPKYESKPPAWLDYFWKRDAVGDRCPWLSLLDLGDKIMEIDPIFVWGLNYSIRKKTLFDLGGFHPDNIPSRLQYFQGDGETGLSQKIKRNGFKTIYDPAALVYHVIPKERLTSEYFEKRAFYQGVCGSYTEIRRSGKIPKAGTITKEESSAFKDIIARTRRAFYFLFIRGKNPAETRTFEQLLVKTKKSYIRGYNYHQQAVIDHPELLDWITKEDYFDYQLPKLKLNDGSDKK